MNRSCSAGASTTAKAIRKHTADARRATPRLPTVALNCLSGSGQYVEENNRSQTQDCSAYRNNHAHWSAALNRASQACPGQSRGGRHSNIGRKRKADNKPCETDQQHGEIERSRSAPAEGGHGESLRCAAAGS